MVGIRVVALSLALGSASSPGAAVPGSLVYWGSERWDVAEIPPGLEGRVVAVDVGSYHAMAVEEDGTVHAWGGEGSDSEGVSHVPVGLDKVRDVAAGETISIALRYGGEVVSWGSRFASGAETPEDLEGVVVKQIAAGYHHGLAVTSAGRVVAWGEEYSGQSTVPEGLDQVVAVAGGGWHSLALREDGTVVAWGYNGDGQTDVPPGLSDAVAIAAGANHSLALLGDGTVVAWGRSNEGQTAVPEGLDRVTAIEAASRRSLALREDGTIVAWGSEDHYWYFDAPVDLGPVLALTAGGYHTFALVSSASPAPGSSVPYIRSGDRWKFWDRGTEPRDGWRGHPMDDSDWGRGPTQLGYGDGDEATVVGYGPDPSDKHLTTWFRRTFTAANPQIIEELDAWLLWDDGAVVYLNGTEVARVNLPSGPVGPDTRATNRVSNNATTSFTIDPGLLVAGANVLAVEVHQVSPNSSDISFDFELTGSTGPPPAVPRPGSLDPSFTGRLVGTGSVLSLARQPADGKFLVGGYFTGVSGGDRQHLARLDPDGGLDATFVPSSPDGVVRAVQSLSSGEVLIGGNFLRVGESARPGVAKLGSGGALIGSFLPEIGEPCSVYALLELPDRQLLLSGWFSGHGTPFGHRLDRFAPETGSFDLSFAAPAADNSIQCLLRQPDGKVLAGGGFGIVHGVARQGVARFHPDGTLDDSFNQGTGAVSHVVAMALQGDGKLVLGGGIYKVHGVQTYDLVRLTPDGQLDPDFHLPRLDFGQVNAVTVQSDGRILAAGDFRIADGLPYSGIIRLLPDGTIDPSFDPGTGIDGVDAAIHALLLLPDGDILIGGEFSYYDGAPVNGLARIHGGDGVTEMGFAQRVFDGMTVRLAVAAPPGTLVHAVEELLPEGWTATDITDGGEFDSVTGKVKFGPYHDDASRNLSYRVVPAAGADGMFLFSGQVSADGVNSPIGGEAGMLVSGRHPADFDPPDWQLQLHEVTAYGAAWRRGDPWPAEPGRIRIDYVTRAAFLWRRGECYTVDYGLAGPPQWWVPCAQASAPVTASGPTPGSDGGAERLLPGSFLPGEAVAVTIKVVPPAGSSAWAVEDSVPEGWSVESVSDGGEADTVGGSVKWGPFMDDQPRSLDCRIVSPEAATGAVSFAGSVSFDGQSEVVGGAQGSRPTCMVSACRPMDGGRILLEVRGLQGAPVGIEASNDLVHWFLLETAVPLGGWLEFDDPERGNSPRRFYRLRPPAE